MTQRQAFLGTAKTTISVTKALAAAADYGANDVLSESASAGTVWTFSSVVSANGGTGTIVKAIALLEEAGESFVHPSARVEGSFLMRSAVMERCEVADSQLTDCIVLPGAQLHGCRFDNAIIAAGATWHAGEQAS